MENIILHCDMNNYFASVECIDKPLLKTVPMAVCGDPAMRHGIILSKNDEAKKFGVVTGESSYAAKNKCPKLIIIRPNYQKYLQYAKLAREIYARYTDKIYPYGMDEAWLDLTGKYESIDEGITIADEIRRSIRDELCLTASVGVSFNFVFSKLASDMKKPDTTSILPKECLEKTIWNIPAFDMLFVGSATRKILRQMGILTIGDIARSDPSKLFKKLGKRGKMFWEFANGNDSSFDPCTNDEDDIKSLGNTITPPKDITNQKHAAAFLYLLSGTVAKRLKRHRFKASCICIVLRREDFSQITRQKTFVQPTDNQDIIFKYAYDLLCKNHNWEHSIRSIGVKADKLTGEKNEQLSLFDFIDNHEQNNSDIAKIITEIKEKYGSFDLEISATSKDIDISIMDC